MNSYERVSLAWTIFFFSVLALVVLSGCARPQPIDEDVWIDLKHQREGR